MLSKKCWRWVLSKFDEGQLMGLMSAAGTELLARQVHQHIAPSTLNLNPNLKPETRN